MKNTYKNDFARHFHRKYIKIWKMRPGDSQSEPKGRKSKWKGRQSEPKVSQSEPKVRQREPKVSQREPKRGQREPKGSTKGAQREPMGDQNASKNRLSDRIAKSMDFDGPGCFLEPFWSHFPLKFNEKSMWKSMPKMLWKLMKVRCENGTEIYADFDDFRKSFSRQIEFSEKGVPTQTTIFMQ